MVEIREIVASSILTPQKVGSLSGHYHFSLNPYSGCMFACSYCYVPKFPNARHDVAQWGRWLEVKVNAPELIQRERARVFGSRIFFSSATDPYQYAELRYGLSHKCLQKLLLYQPSKVTLHTRSHLVLRDLPLLKEFGRTLSVGVSLTTDDDSVRREFEPNAPNIHRRLELIRRLCDEDIDVYVSISPLLPCDPERFVALLPSTISRIWIDAMRWGEINRSPELLEKYAQHFQPDAYQSKINLMRQLFSQRAISDCAMRVRRSHAQSMQTDTASAINIQRGKTSQSGERVADTSAYAHNEESSLPAKQLSPISHRSRLAETAQVTQLKLLHDYL